jgi:hypothetical protein
MNILIAELTEMTRTQKTLVPSIYGRIDFSSAPERFTVNPEDQTELGRNSLRGALSCSQTNPSWISSERSRFGATRWPTNTPP